MSHFEESTDLMDTAYEAHYPIISVVQDRPDNLINQLCEIWEASVRATHDFLTEADIVRIARYVPDAIQEVKTLLIAQDAQGTPLGFCGVENGCIEMLFLDPSARGKGIGKQFLQLAIAEHGATRVDVNEQNPAARGFYEHEGFKVVSRSETDSMGDPFPILHLQLA